MVAITENRLVHLNESRATCVAHLRRILHEMGDRAIHSSGNEHGIDARSVHYDEARRLDERIQIIDRIVHAAKIVTPPVHTNHLCIQHMATFDVLTTERPGVHIKNPTMEEFRCIVGGFEETDLATRPPTVSYRSPRILPSMNQVVGYTEIIQYHGVIQEIELAGIAFCT